MECLRTSVDEHRTIVDSHQMLVDVCKTIVNGHKIIVHEHKIIVSWLGTTVDGQVVRWGKLHTTVDISKNFADEPGRAHTARRSLATNLVLRGVSPYVVMKVTGHKSLSSFERYVRLQELEAVMELKNLSFFQ